MVVSNRRMDRAARLLVNQGEAEGSVFAKATPGQGVRLYSTAPAQKQGEEIARNAPPQ